MKSVISLFIFFLLTTSHLMAERTKKKSLDSSNQSKNKNQTYTDESYSILIEEDYESVMFMYRYSDNKNNAEIIEYGGFKWFKKVFEGNEDKGLTVAIQPNGTGVSGNERTWFTPRYLLNSFRHIYEEKGGNQSIKFITNDGFITINGYISRGQGFEFSAKSRTAWYAGTFTPVKTIDDFKKIANKNSVVFCMIMNDLVLTEYNRELKVRNMKKILEQEGYKCDSNNNLR